eukprot:TRINITY_DN313_c0_g1_i3.p1 TRINITY_DN313_c0_g1~~TRINITY_DN313_c0_g1_i3.p1  ORF type:complete len:108 (-),score=33.94 TRINITY_DN313_c0_g1_i3:405-728(-)
MRWFAIGVSAAAVSYYQLHQDLFTTRLEAAKQLEAVTGASLIRPIPPVDHSGFEAVRDGTEQQFVAGWNSRVDDLYRFVRTNTEGANLPDIPGKLTGFIKSVGERDK